MRRFGFVLLILGILMAGFNVGPAFARAGTCSGYMEKIDGVDSTSVTISAPDGYIITEWCYKAATETHTGSANSQSVTIHSTVTNENGQVQDISHVAYNYEPVATATATATELPTFTVTAEFTATYTPENTATPTEVIIPTNTVVIPTETIEATPTNPEDPTATPQDPTETPQDTPTSGLPTNTPQDTPTVIPTGTEVIVMTDTPQGTATVVLVTPATVTPGSQYSCDDVIKLWNKTHDPRWRQWLDKRPWCERHPTKTPKSPTTGVGDGFSPTGNGAMGRFGLGIGAALLGLVLVTVGGKRKQYNY